MPRQWRSISDPGGIDDGLQTAFGWVFATKGIKRVFIIDKIDHYLNTCSSIQLIVEDKKHIIIWVIISPSFFGVHKFNFTRSYSVATSVVLAWHVYSHCIKYSEKFLLIFMYQVNLLTFSMMMAIVWDWLSTGVTCYPNFHNIYMIYGICISRIATCFSVP